MNKNRQEQFFLVLLLIIWSVLTMRLLYIQLIKWQFFQQTSAEIRARLIPSAAPRGMIYDRYGNVLASSRPAYAVYILPTELKNKNRTLKRLAEITGLSLKEINERLNKPKHFFEPVLVLDYAPFRQIALLEEEKNELPGVNIGYKTIRYYPYGAVAAHVLGHVGEVSRQELFSARGKGLRLGEIIGLSGIEKSYDRYLRGISGGQQIEVDAQGRPIKRTQSLVPIPGQEIYLTLDIGLQKKAEELLGSHKGALIVLNVNSGEVLALASNPGFDPNLFAGVISKKEWESLITDKENPFHNRALTAYPPGSTFKIFTALAALGERLTSATKQFFCPGYLQIGRRRAACWNVHGQLSFFDAIVQSCDVVFYNMGLQLGINKLNKYAVSCGLGAPTGIDLPLEEAGLIPSEEWKQERLRREWYPGDSMNAAIGQGFIQVTPIQLVTALAGIVSSKNILYRPFLCKKITDEKGKVLLENTPYELSRIPFDPGQMDILRQALHNVVLRGTGTAALTSEIAIGGKTGTAEDPPRPRPHAWFVGYAPVQNPQVAVVVFLESGGHGGNAATPLARDIILWWDKHRGR